MHSEKGITLTSLVIYVLGITIIISIITIISTYFYKNISVVSGTGKNSEIYTAFNMYFLGDIKKKNIDISSCTGDTLLLSDGTSYQYVGTRLYRNGAEILKNINLLNFESKTQGEKKIITVKIAIPGNIILTRSTDYVLQYW